MIAASVIKGLKLHCENHLNLMKDYKRVEIKKLQPLRTLHDNNNNTNNNNNNNNNKQITH